MLSRWGWNIPIGRSATLAVRLERDRVKLQTGGERKRHHASVPGSGLTAGGKVKIKRGRIGDMKSGTGMVPLVIVMVCSVSVICLAYEYV